MGPTWGPPGSCQPQMGRMWAPWTLLSWIISIHYNLLNMNMWLNVCYLFQLHNTLPLKVHSSSYRHQWYCSKIYPYQAPHSFPMISTVNESKDLSMKLTLLWFIQMCYLWYSLEWSHNGRNSISNHQPANCLLNRSFRCRSKKHQSSASVAFVRGIHWGPVNSLHKWPVTRKMFPFDDVIMCSRRIH